MNEKYDSALY